jgi:hypothetical protein
MKILNKNISDFNNNYKINLILEIFNLLNMKQKINKYIKLALREK